MRGEPVLEGHDLAAGSIHGVGLRLMVAEQQEDDLEAREQLLDEGEELVVLEVADVTQQGEIRGGPLDDKVVRRVCL